MTNNRTIEAGAEVKVSLFDGNLKNAEGRILGGSKNSRGENVYLVEMVGTKSNHPEHAVGHAQIEHGHPWVLSCYQEELQI